MSIDNTILMDEETKKLADLLTHRCCARERAVLIGGKGRWQCFTCGSTREVLLGRDIAQWHGDRLLAKHNKGDGA